MSSTGSFLASALETAVQTYIAIASLKDPASAAAFGIACYSIQERLNCSLEVAADMLRGELNRRGVGTEKPSPTS